MARRCQVTGKGPMVGNNVSHANNRTKRRQMPNLQNKRIFVEELGEFVRVRLSASALKTVTRKGLMPYLREQGMTLEDVR
ncbi:MAG TPA: 50S ribosomal protein L28 [Calditrichia bacterium]|nr:50S ribosomal protein L28 [Calditrichota bacterium]HQV34588.1 50S ribosomal protein L28 [Calditrichia bacterium]